MSEDLSKYFDGDELAASVWLNKYATEGEKTPDDMHKRLAKEFWRIEEKYQKDEKINKNLSEYGQKRQPLTEQRIFELFKDFKYIIPQGRVMAGLGIDSAYKALSNCLVLPSPKDSYSSIMYTDTMLVNAAKRGCGYGLDLSNLRPYGVETKNASKTSTGIIPFMERYSNSTREVGQDSRRGACLLSIDIRHPQSLDFAQAKSDRTKVTGANISIKLRDDFMMAVEKDIDYVLRFPVDSFLTLNKYDEWYPDWNNGKLNYIPKDDCYVKVVSAKKLWNTIIKQAREDSEPGLFLWDRMINYDPCSVYENHQIVCTNACGEQPMSALDTCRLICVNLYSFVDNPFTPQAKMNYEKLYEVSYEQLRIGDDLVELEIEYVNRIINKIKNDPEPKEEKQIELDMWLKVKNKAIKGRRVGCGLTALGDMLAALGLKYDSDEALKVVEKVMKIKMESELDASIDLSILRGSFPDWDNNKEYPISNDDKKLYGNDFYYFLQTNFTNKVKKMQKFGRRNLNWSTIAPTGSVSILTQTTSGCEPLFQPYYTRRRKINPSDEGLRVDFVDQNGDKWQNYFVLHPKFKEFIYINYNGEIPEILSNERLEELYKKSPYYKSTANDINWIKRIEIQSILQKYTTAAISSTLNLPENVSVEEVGKIYFEAWKKGLKGVTIYRDNSRSGVLVSSAQQREKFTEKSAPKRPKNLPCKVLKFQNNNEKWIAFVGLYEGKPYEIFTGIAEEFNIPNNVEEGIIHKVKLIDNKKRYDFEYFSPMGESVIVKNLSKAFKKEYWNYAKLISSMLRHAMPLQYVIKTIEDMSFDNNTITTWKAGVVRSLKKFVTNNTISDKKCLDCGQENVIYENGCLVCRNCGSSKCG